MPQSGNPSTSTSPAIPEEFGANEWLVEEMHDRYQQDPSSVDPTWAAYFSGNGSTTDTSSSAPTAKTETNGSPAQATQPRPPRPSPRFSRRPSPRPSPSARHPHRPSRRRPRPTPHAGARTGGQAAARGEGRRARRRAPASRSPRTRRPPSARPRATSRSNRAARRPGPHRGQHGRLAHRAHRHLGALGARSSCCGTTARHQQPPRPGPRRQGLLHPPHRLRPDPGPAGDAGDERRLRRRRRQAQPDHAGPHQPRPGHRRPEVGRHPPAAGAVDQGRRGDGLRGVLDRLRGHRPQGARRQAARSPTSRARRSA